MDGADLFSTMDGEQDAKRSGPLADLMRPTDLSEIVGQDHLVGENGALKRQLAARKLSSLIFWGPPGSGKTSLARLLAEGADLHFTQISAIFSGVSELRKIFEQAKIRRSQGQGSLLFVDEIHRFNRAQLDGFLPYVEDGTIILVGATTENPSFELNAALLSRAKVLILHRLDNLALAQLLERAEAYLGLLLPLTDDARDALIALSDGDGRYLLNMVEELSNIAGDRDAPLDREQLSRLLQQRVPIYDKGQDGHYNLISALHKSVRGSDVDAALYWLARMLGAGEDPLYIARRVVRMAVEDIGLADPAALVQAQSAAEAYQFLGSPEGELALAQAVIYVATAPKSNAAYTAWKAALNYAKKSGSLAPPKHITNAPTKLMRDQGFSVGYVYDHDTAHGFSGQRYFPDQLEEKTFYRPKDRGFERDLHKRLDYWTKLRTKHRAEEAE